MAKRTRRARRLDFDQQIQPGRQPVKEADAVGLPVTSPPLTNGAKLNGIAAASMSRVVDFAREYYYVYRELSHILIVTVLMFIVMVLLAFLI